MAPECMDPVHFTGISQLVAAELLLKPRKQHRICRKHLFAAETSATSPKKKVVLISFDVCFSMLPTFEVPDICPFLVMNPQHTASRG